MTDRSLLDLTNKAAAILRGVAESRHWPEEGHQWGLLLSEAIWSDLVEVSKELDAALAALEQAQPDQPQEPVAWRDRCG